MIPLPFFLYAETHYRFKYFFSFLKKAEPEIIADGPHRLDPDTPYPILLFIKDADRYPIELISTTLTLIRDGKELYSETVQPPSSVKISDHYWWNVIELQFQKELDEVYGFLTLKVEITIRQNGRIKIITNNNHRTSSKTPLKFYRSRTSLPSLPGWFYGDTHTHSQYTEDQVEFGSPIAAAPALCKAMGLSFFCVADHSYDLDDRIDNYLVNDQNIPKWYLLQEEIDEVNEKEKNFVAVRGEEVSCTNKDGRNVHLLLHGTRKYFHGSGDSAEKWFHTKCEHTVDGVLLIKDSNVAAYAAHPTEEVPLLQRLLINRGEWRKADMNSSSLHGIQILNGEYAENFVNGLDVWKWLLLKGEKKFISAGNDAHGNFNRFIQIGIPFFKIREKETQLFGKMKTALFTSLSETAIVSALRYGRSFITSGPLLVIEIETDQFNSGTIGDTILGKKFLVKVKAKTTEEFGKFISVKLIHGIIGKRERILLEMKDFSDPFNIHFITDWETAAMFSYIRAEGFTANGTGTDREGFCFTNPIWISQE